MAASQVFTTPTMPFKREVHNGCAIGTSIMIMAKPYQDQGKGCLVELASVSDLALSLSIPLNTRGQLSATARVNGQFTSEVQKDVQLPYNKTFNLHIRLNSYVAEVYVDDQHLLDFVHRVDPREIKQVAIEGPLIVEQVIFRPPQGASLNTLPTYDEFANHSIVPTRAQAELKPPSYDETAKPQPQPSVPGGPGGPGGPPIGLAATSTVPLAATQMARSSREKPPYPLEENKKGEIPQKEKPVGPPVAQIAPQTNEMQNQPYRPPGSTPYPGATQPGYPGATQPGYPGGPGYPTSGGRGYPSGAPPAAGYAGSLPSAPPTNYPSAPPNYPPQGYNPYGNQPQGGQYPGPSGPPMMPGYPPYQAAAAVNNYIPQPVHQTTVYQQAPPPTVVYQQPYMTAYPSYYPSFYYDDCHHHHHC